MQPNLNLKDGLSGILRAKNEARFVSACIESCIDALDELIIVYNDCSDTTPQIIKEKQRKYPDKIKIYPYEHNILAYDLTKDQLEYIIGLPEGSPQLLSTYYNFALSKVSYRYCLKIDADQIYFTDELKKWRDLCHTIPCWKHSFFIGGIFMNYFSVYRRLSSYFGKPFLRMLPDKLIEKCFTYYKSYAGFQLLKGKAAISLSGLNVFKDEEWYVPFDGLNIHPPYNGEGDTLIFRLTRNTFFSKFYNGVSNCVIEKFNCPYKVMYTGPIWFHLHALRENCWHKVKEYKDNNPEQFVPIEKFPLMTYEEVNKKMDHKSHSVYQRTLFALIHKQGCHIIKKYLNLLDNIE